MPDLATLIANVAKIRGFIAVYLDLPKLNAKQAEALRVDLQRLDLNLAALNDYVAPSGARLAAANLAPPVVAPSNRASNILYGPWAREWFAANFEGTASAAEIIAAATKDGVLAQVCAGGILGTPSNEPNGDWSLYSGLLGTSDAGEYVFNLWLNGTLVATTRQTDPDGLPWAIANGFDPN